MVLRNILSRHLLFLTLFINLINATANSICYDTGLQNLRPCAGGCVACQYGYPDQIGQAIGCPSDNPNECYCRTDLFSSATSLLSSCVASRCSTIVGGWDADYSSAEFVYGSYCRKAGYTAAGNAAPATKVTATTTSVDPNAPTVTQVTIVTPTGAKSSGVDSTTVGAALAATGSTQISTTSLATLTTSVRSQVTVEITSTLDTAAAAGSTGGSSGGGLSTSDRIALGCGIGVGLPATLAAIVSCIIAMRGRG